MKRLIMIIMAVALLLPGVSQATTMSGADYTSSAGRIISGGSSATPTDTASYNDAAAGVSINVTRADQSITFNSTPNVGVGGTV